MLLLGLFWQTRPFATPIVVQTVSLSNLSPAQRGNILLAAARLDGLILRPGEVFSFNRVVGPRSLARGYQAAPSYLEGESPSTVGGGICLLSSALYQLALRGGLMVTERVPHLRTIRSVLPGLDATVWYGQADLKFRNTQPFPLQIRVLGALTSLQVSLYGKEAAEGAALQRVVKNAGPRGLQVEVYREFQHRAERVSQDLYRSRSQSLPLRQHPSAQ